MRAVIIGTGKAGMHLCEELLVQGHTVTLVERSVARCTELESALLGSLRERLPGDIHLVHGDGSSPVVLRQVATRADVLVAVTGSDEANLAAALVARHELRIGRVLARINHPRNEWLFTPEMGVDVGISVPHLLASLVLEETTLGDLVTLLKLRRGQLALVEERLHPQSRAVGKQIGQLDLPPEAHIVAILRGNQVLLPAHAGPLQAGDEILALSTSAAERALAEALR
jgi:trk system potassium uptake protein TrkA